MGDSIIWRMLLGLLAIQFCILLVQSCRCKPKTTAPPPDLSLGGRGLMGRLAKDLGLSPSQANSMLAARAFPGLSDTADPSPPNQPSPTEEQKPRRRGWGWGWRRWGRRRNNQQKPNQPATEPKPDLSGMNKENYEKLLTKYGIAPDAGAKTK